MFYPPPSCSSLRSRLPRNNNRGSVHQHSFMAPHYAKRRAKGAWHFFPVSRRIRKDRLRLPLLAFFFYSSTMFLDQRHHCLAVVVTRGVEAIPSPFGRHAVSQIVRRPASNRSSYIDVEHVSFIVKLPYQLTFRCIERIDMPRSLASNFINCIDTRTVSGSAAIDVRNSWLSSCICTHIRMYISITVVQQPYETIELSK